MNYTQLKIEVQKLQEPHRDSGCIVGIVGREHFHRDRTFHWAGLPWGLTFPVPCRVGSVPGTLLVQFLQGA